MILRSSLAVVLLGLSGCSPYKMVREGDSNPLAGKTSLGLQWLDWGGVYVDGAPEDAWMANHRDWLKDWPGNKSTGGDAFRKGVAEGLAGSPLTLLTRPDPSGASATVKPSVVEIDTGGWNPTKLKISVKVLDANGATLEEITTVVQGKGSNFDARLSEAATRAGENVAKYLKKRAKN